MDIMSRKEKEKQVRKEDLINAAEKIFSTMGYTGASMDEIAKEAEFSRKTLYQYFKDKESLYFTVVVRGFKRLLSFFQEAIKNNNTGLEKLQCLASAYYRFYQTFPSTLEIMNYVGYVKIRGKFSAEYQEFNKINELMTQEITKVIDEGKLDGSIRTDLDTLSITYSAEFLITGFFHMLSVSGKTFTNYHSLKKEDFINFNLNLLCDAFCAEKHNFDNNKHS